MQRKRLKMKRNKEHLPTQEEVLDSILSKYGLYYDGKALVDKETNTCNECSLRGVFGQELFRNKEPALNDVEILNKVILFMERREEVLKTFEGL